MTHVVHPRGSRQKRMFVHSPASSLPIPWTWSSPPQRLTHPARPTTRHHVPRAFNSPYGPVANVIWYGADADDRTKVTYRPLGPLPHAPKFPENRRSKLAISVKWSADTHPPRAVLGCVLVTVPAMSTRFPCV